MRVRPSGSSGALPSSSEPQPQPTGHTTPQRPATLDMQPGRPLPAHLLPQSVSAQQRPRRSPPGAQEQEPLRYRLDRRTGQLEHSTSVRNAPPPLYGDESGQEQRVDAAMQPWEQGPLQRPSAWARPGGRRPDETLGSVPEQDDLRIEPVDARTAMDRPYLQGPERPPEPAAASYPSTPWNRTEASFVKKQLEKVRPEYQPMVRQLVDDHALANGKQPVSLSLDSSNHKTPALKSLLKQKGMWERAKGALHSETNSFSAFKVPPFYLKKGK